MRSVPRPSCGFFSRAAVHDGEATPASSALERKRTPLGARSCPQSPSSDRAAHGPPPTALRRRLEPSSGRLAPGAAGASPPGLGLGVGDHLPGLQTQDPRKTPLYGLLESLYERVKGAWEERFERSYGFWRGLVDEVVASYLA